jgi:hypothetical protein
MVRNHTRATAIAQLPRSQRRVLDRGARLDALWFERRHNQCRVARLRAAIAGEGEALVRLSDNLPPPRKPDQRILVVVVQLEPGVRLRKPVLWTGKPLPLDREDLPLALATHEPGLVSLAGLEATTASWPRWVQ